LRVERAQGREETAFSTAEVYKRMKTCEIASLGNRFIMGHRNRCHSSVEVGILCRVFGQVAPEALPKDVLNGWLACLQSVGHRLWGQRPSLPFRTEDLSNIEHRTKGIGLQVTGFFGMGKDSHMGLNKDLFTTHNTQIEQENLFLHPYFLCKQTHGFGTI